MTIVTVFCSCPCYREVMEARIQKLALEMIRQGAIDSSKRPDLSFRRRLLYRRLAEVIRLKLEKAS